MANQSTCIFPTVQIELKRKDIDDNGGQEPAGDAKEMMGIRVIKSYNLN